MFAKFAGKDFSYLGPVGKMLQTRLEAESQDIKASSERLRACAAVTPHLALVVGNADAAGYDAWLDGSVTNESRWFPNCMHDHSFDGQDNTKPVTLAHNLPHFFDLKHIVHSPLNRKSGKGMNALHGKSVVETIWSKLHNLALDGSGLVGNTSN